MVMDYSLFDINLHMINHYRRIHSAKSVVQTFQNCHLNIRSKDSRIHSQNSSRYSTPIFSGCSARVPNASRPKSQCEVRNVYCPKEPMEKLQPVPTGTKRATSLPPYHNLKDTTRNVPGSRIKSDKTHKGKVPGMKFKEKNVQRITKNTQHPVQGPSPVMVETKPQSVQPFATVRKSPVPTPRISLQKSIVSTDSVPEFEYLQFALRITEDIIRNDLYTVKEMQRVFNSHIEANRGRLKLKKMRQQIELLCKELNIAKKTHRTSHLIPEQLDSFNTFTQAEDFSCASTCHKYGDKDEIFNKIITGEKIITEEEIKQMTEKDLHDVISELLYVHEEKAVDSDMITVLEEQVKVENLDPSMTTCSVTNEDVADNCKYSFISSVNDETENLLAQHSENLHHVPNGIRSDEQISVLQENDVNNQIMSEHSRPENSSNIVSGLNDSYSNVLEEIRSITSCSGDGFENNVAREEEKINKIILDYKNISEKTSSSDNFNKKIVTPAENTVDSDHLASARNESLSTEKFDISQYIKLPFKKMGVDSFAQTSFSCLAPTCRFTSDEYTTHLVQCTVEMSNNPEPIETMPDFTEQYKDDLEILPSTDEQQIDLNDLSIHSELNGLLIIEEQITQVDSPLSDLSKKSIARSIQSTGKNQENIISSLQSEKQLSDDTIPEINYRNPIVDTEAPLINTELVSSSNTSLSHIMESKYSSTHVEPENIPLDNSISGVSRTEKYFSSGSERQVILSTEQLYDPQVLSSNMEIYPQSFNTSLQEAYKLGDDDIKKQNNISNNRDECICCKCTVLDSVPSNFISEEVADEETKNEDALYVERIVAELEKNAVARPRMDKDVFDEEVCVVSTSALLNENFKSVLGAPKEIPSYIFERSNSDLETNAIRISPWFDSPHDVLSGYIDESLIDLQSYSSQKPKYTSQSSEKNESEICSITLDKSVNKGEGIKCVSQTEEMSFTKKKGESVSSVPASEDIYPLHASISEHSMYCACKTNVHTLLENIRLTRENQIQMNLKCACHEDSIILTKKLSMPSIQEKSDLENVKFQLNRTQSLPDNLTVLSYDITESYMKNDSKTARTCEETQPIHNAISNSDVKNIIENVKLTVKNKIKPDSYLVINKDMNTSIDNFTLLTQKDSNVNVSKADLNNDQDVSENTSVKNGDKIPVCINSSAVHEIKDCSRTFLKNIHLQENATQLYDTSDGKQMIIKNLACYDQDVQTSDEYVSGSRSTSDTDIMPFEKTYMASDILTTDSSQLTVDPDKYLIKKNLNLNLTDYEMDANVTGKSDNILYQLKKYENDILNKNEYSKPCPTICNYKFETRVVLPKYKHTFFFPSVATQTSSLNMSLRNPDLSEGEIIDESL